MSKFGSEYKSVGAVILAAGFSSRMKIQKPFLKYNENSVFIQKIIDNFLEFGCNIIVITVNNGIHEWKKIQDYYKENPSIFFIANQFPEFERFYSIKIGLGRVANSNFCFIHNVDNPFIDKGILNLIYENKFEKGYTVPVYNGIGGHPVLLSQNVIKRIIAEKDNNKNFKDVLGDFERKNVELDTDKIHININSPIEYEKYFPNQKL
jgi:CTP:molybdopterin cytidylyltransferase MocA